MFVLGLSFDIDAAATLLQDGVPVAAVAEERFTRVKHDRDFPRTALNYCLQHAGITMPEVEWCALGWNPTIHLQPMLWRQSSRIRHHAEYLSAVPNQLLQAYQPRPRGVVTEQVHHFGPDTPPLKVAYVEHHLCHAAWSYVSPFERAAILTVDGFGEGTSTTLGLCEGTALSQISATQRPHSLGSLYAAITQYLGFRPNRDEGTVMSLAAMAEPRFADQFRQMVRWDENGVVELDLNYFAFFLESTSRVSPLFEQTFGPARLHGEPIEERHKAVAASLQLVFEEAYIALLRTLHQRTGCDDLVVAGGVALNCVANGRIQQETPFKRVFIPPASGDDGASTGAALYLYHSHLGHPRGGHVFQRAYLGPQSSDAEVGDLLQLAARDFQTLSSEALPKVAARLLSEGHILGWYQGRAEFGPRALGNRTILADPRSQEVKDRLNNTVKFRLPFRPFAPSMLAHRCNELFIDGGDSPFMLFAYTVRPEWAERVPGILHYDNTARVQTVTREENPLYYDLIEQFEALTGVPVVLNTSLNVRGTPIANSPTDALACFDSTAIDFLFIGSHVLAKPGTRHAEALQRAMDEAGA